MLNKIPHIIPPELMMILMQMGHSDTIVLADANFPAYSHSRRCIFCPGVEVPELLEAILPYFPLDGFVTDPVKLMRNLDTEPVPQIWKEYERIIRTQDEEDVLKTFAFLDRLAFYEEANHARVVVQTGTEARYANIILQKGVVTK